MSGHPSVLLEVVADPARAATALSPIRRRALTALAEGPDSATGLAERLGTTRQRLNYHLRELEKAGFLELVEERRKGNCVERVLRAKARHWLIDPGALADLAGEPLPPADRFSAAYLVALAARAIREVAGLTGKAADSRKRLATLAIDADVKLARPADFPAFADELARAVGEVIARHHDEDAPGGRRFRVMAGAWPGKKRKPGEARRKKEER
ncbi:MAG TPA: winged helix-turn-helix domain-containing protein [Gemmatimonadota bacterium]|nr:winged helix-turn-helix domain-containing protein [Gemmatimonadota bacterium]